jgi:hypothetical protein
LQFTAQCSAAGSRHLAVSLSVLTCLTSLVLERIPLRQYVAEAEDDEEFEEAFEPEELMNGAAFEALVAADAAVDDDLDEFDEFDVDEHAHVVSAAAALHAALLNDGAGDVDAVGGRAPQAGIASADHSAGEMQMPCGDYSPTALHAALFHGVLELAVCDGEFPALSSANSNAGIAAAQSSTGCEGEEQAGGRFQYAAEAEMNAAFAPAASEEGTTGASASCSVTNQSNASDACGSTDVACMMAAKHSEVIAFESDRETDGCSDSAGDVLRPHPAAADAVELDSVDEADYQDADIDYASVEAASPITAAAATAAFPASFSPSQSSVEVVLAALESSSRPAWHSRAVRSFDSAFCSSADSYNSTSDHYNPLFDSLSAAPDSEEPGSHFASIEGCEIAALSDDDGPDEAYSSMHAPYAPLEATITAMKSYSSLRALTLYQTDVGCNVELCGEFGRALSQHSLLERLVVKENSFCDDGLAALLGNLGNLSRLTELRIVESVAFEATAALASVLPMFVSLRCLSLTHFRPMLFDNLEGRALFQAIALVPHLEVLTMCSCHLNVASAWWLSDSLRCMRSLNEINLSDNDLMGNMGCQQVARALSKIPTLEKLKMNDVGATLRGIKSIGWFFRKHKRIKECWVSQRGLEQDEDALEARREQFKERMPWLLLYRASPEDDIV